MSDKVSVTKQESPYRGIHPFRYADSSYFCGRDALIKELESNVLLHRLVILFGKSGAGKSSVVNAGLIPALEKEGLKCERLRVGTSPEYPVLLERTVGDNGLLLPSIFDQSGETDAAHSERTIPLSLETFLSCSSRFTDSKPQTPTPTVALIFDQFEELFTRFEFARNELGSDMRLWQRRLTDTVVALATQGSSRLRLLLVIREDFLAGLEVMARDYPRVIDYRVRLTYLTGTEAVSAILDPLRKNRFSSAIAPDLAQVIVKDVAKAELDNPSSSEGKSGNREIVKEEALLRTTQFMAEAIIPPTQIQIVCRELWDSFAGKTGSIGIAEYELKGKVQGILKGFFQSELSEVSPELRRPVILILQNLITDSATRDVVSEKRLKDLVLADGVTEPHFLAALNRLMERRLVDMSSQRGTRFYEVASEYLIPSILKEAQIFELDWARAKAAEKSAREVAEKEREAARQREFVQLQKLAEEQTQRAETQQRLAERTAELLAEQRRRTEEQTVWARKMRWITAGLAVMYTAVVILAVLLYVQRTNVQHNYQLSHARELAFAAEKRYLSDPDLSIKLALESVYVNWKTDHTVLPETQSALELVTQSRLSVSDFGPMPKGVSLSGDWRHIATVNSDDSIGVQETVFQSGKLLLQPSASTIQVTASGDPYANVNDAMQTSPNLQKSHSPSCQFPNVSASVSSQEQEPAVRTVTLWEATSVKPSVTLLGADVAPIALPAFSQDGDYLAFTRSGYEADAILWKVDSGSDCKWQVLSGHQSKVSALAFSSPKTGLLATGSVDGTTKLWNIHHTGRELRTLPGDQSPILAVAFSPDGKRVVTGSTDRAARLWEVETQKEARVLTGHNGSVVALAFSPNGKLLATGSLDNSIKIWDAETGKFLKNFTIQPGFPALAFSRDGKRLAVASSTVTTVWDVENWTVLYHDVASKDSIAAVGMNDNGSQFVTVAANGNLIIHTIRLGDGIARAGKRGVKKFSKTECKDLVHDEKDCNNFYDDRKFNCAWTTTENCLLPDK